MTLENIIKFAKASIYDTAEHIGDWKGYGVYEPGFNDEEEHCVGFPSFILASCHRRQNRLHKKLFY